MANDAARRAVSRQMSSCLAGPTSAAWTVAHVSSADE